MQAHEIWHVVVLVSTLLGAAALVLLLLAPLVFDEPPRTLARMRVPLLVALFGAGALLLVEWLGIHGRSL